MKRGGDSLVPELEREKSFAGQGCPRSGSVGLSAARALRQIDPGRTHEIVAWLIATCNKYEHPEPNVRVAEDGWLLPPEYDGFDPAVQELAHIGPSAREVLPYLKQMATNLCLDLDKRREAFRACQAIEHTDAK